MHANNKKLVIITNARFWQAGAGYWARTRATIMYLANQFDLTVIFNDPFDDRELSQVRKLQPSLNFQWIGNQACDTVEHRQQALRALLARQPTADLYLVDKTKNAYLVDCLPEKATKLLDTHDIIHQRNKNMRQQGLKDDFALTARQERKIFSQFDAIICIQEEDYKLVSQWQPDYTCLLVPHPIKPMPQTLRERASRIGIIASGWHANVHGLNHFIDTIWAQIQRDDITLHIYGYVTNAFMHLDQPAIIRHGFQPKLADCYNNLDIIINPVKYGAGLKIKTIEAMAYGIPLVTTKEGASGLTHLSNKAFQMACNDQQFIDQINLLLNNSEKRKQLSKFATDYVQQNMSEAQCFSPLTEFIRKS